MQDKRTLLNELRALDFVLLETGLYLHGNRCEEAEADMKAFSEKRKAVAEEYERCYGPLLLRNGADSGKWTFSKGPWPWECETH